MIAFILQKLGMILNVMKFIGNWREVLSTTSQRNRNPTTLTLTQRVFAY